MLSIILHASLADSCENDFELLGFIKYDEFFLPSEPLSASLPDEVSLFT
jgi:hypothetical protein